MKKTHSRFIRFAALAAFLSCEPLFAEAPSPVAWYRADRGVATGERNGFPVVTSIADQAAGGVPAENLSANAANFYPWYVNHAFTRADGSKAPGLRFNRTFTNESAPGMHYLVTQARDLGLNEENESTWVCVFRRAEVAGDNAIFGLNQGGTGGDAKDRFGAFFIGNGNLRLHNHSSNAPNLASALFPAGETMLVTSRRRSVSGVPEINYSINGGAFTTSVAAGGTQFGTTATAPAQLRLGNMMFNMSSGNCFRGDIGEILIFNQSVGDAALIIEHNRLCAAYGIAYSGSHPYSAGGRFAHDLAGIGSLDGGVISEAPAEEGGLGLAADPEALPEGFVYTAHNGAPLQWVAQADGSHALLRRFRIEHTFTENAPALTITLGEKLLGALPDPTLLRLNGISPDPETLTFSLPAGFASGDFMFTLPGAPFAREPFIGSNLQVWYRADAVTDAATLPNLGLMGTALNATAVNAPLLLADAFGGQPTLRFNADADGAPLGSRSQYHKTAATDLGVSTETAWFIAFKPHAANSDIGLFGLEEPINRSRYGAFFIGGGPMRYMAFISGAAGGGDWPLQNTALTPGTPYLGDINSSRLPNGQQHTRSRLNGEPLTLRGDRTYTPCDAPDPKPLRIGSALALGGFCGDIAELRIYNRALTLTETALLRNHLALRYAIPLTGSEPIYQPPSGFTRDFAAIGRLDSLPDPGLWHAQSGPLTLQSARSLSETGLLFLAHNGNNAWYIQSTLPPGEPLTLEARHSGTTPLARAQLLNENGEIIAQAPAEGNAAFLTLSSDDLPSGIYTLKLIPQKGILITIY